MQILRFNGVSIVVADELMAKTLRLAEKAAQSFAPVLLCGESGTGKELIARFIHHRSRGSEGPYVSINCAAIPETLMEAELFGFERGAFTGAIALKLGKFEQANNGSLLLDEISEMSIHLQAKLLRALQEGEVDRLGGKGITRVNARIIATTNKDPIRLIREGQFREDLFFRLNVIRIDCEPLRGRSDAIDCLMREFVARACERDGREPLGISDEARVKMLRHDWPGNVRELQNTIERAVLLAEGRVIGAEDIQLTNVLSALSCSEPQSTSLMEVEREHILKVVEASGGNRTEASRVLGISVRTLRNKLKEYRTTSGS